MTEYNAAPRPGILVVDDDPSIRIFLREAFTRAGWSVWEAGDGLEALGVFEQCRAQLSVVLLDVCMPGLDGVELLSLMRQITADVPCTFMTGFSGRYTIDELEQKSGRPVTYKPFRPAKLVAELTAFARCDTDLR